MMRYVDITVTFSGVEPLEIKTQQQGIRLALSQKSYTGHKLYDLQLSCCLQDPVNTLQDVEDIQLRYTR